MRDHYVYERLTDFAIDYNLPVWVQYEENAIREVFVAETTGNRFFVVGFKGDRVETIALVNKNIDYFIQRALLGHGSINQQLSLSLLEYILKTSASI